MSRLHACTQSLFPINLAQGLGEQHQLLCGCVPTILLRDSKQTPQAWSTPASISTRLEGNKYTALRSTTGAVNSFIEAL